MMYDKLKEYIETDDGNWFWRQDSGVHMNMVDSAIEEIERLQAEVKRLRKALEYIAEGEHLDEADEVAREALQSSN